MQQGTRLLYSLSHHLGPAGVQGSASEHICSVPPPELLQGCCWPGAEPRNHRLSMDRQWLNPKIQPPRAYTSALEIPPDCNLAQVLWVGETLISTKFGINLCGCFYTEGMEKMKKRTTTFCKQYLHSWLQLEKDFAISTEIVNIIDTSNPSLVWSFVLLFFPSKQFV